MYIREVTPSTRDAVELDVFKQHLRVTHNREDTLYESYLKAATRYVEKHTRLIMRDTVFVQEYECFPQSSDIVPVFQTRFRTEYTPVRSIDSLKYYDADDALQTLVAGTDYRVVQGTGGVNYIYKILDWPAIYDREDAVQLTYTAGHQNLSDIPPIATQAILLLATHFVLERAPVNIGRMMTIPRSVDAMLGMLETGVI